MELNSCLYETDVMHCRIRPKRHQFNSSLFMFYLDLDEIDRLENVSKLIGHNKNRIYNFMDKDHFDLDGTTIKEKVLNYLQDKVDTESIKKIMLLTNLRTFGYVFNPVSFYFCFDLQNKPVCVVPEICNTFREIKPFFIKDIEEGKNTFRSQQKKNFYISPFVSVDMPLDFKVRIPDEQLNIQIDDYDEQGKFLYATMSGRKVQLTKRNLILYSLKFPFVTLKIISLIHFHALLLWLKKVPYFEKNEKLDSQKEVYRAWNKR